MAGERSRGAAVAAWVAVPFLGIALFYWAVRPAGRAPVPVPATVEEDYADPDEDAVMEVEEMLQDLAAQLVRRAWGGAMYHVARDFEGTALLREADGSSRVVGGVTIASAGPDARPLDRAGFRTALEAVRIDTLIFKLPSAKLDGSRLASRLKLDASRVEGPRARRWVLFGDSEFVREEGRWKLRRFQGKDGTVEEGAVRFLETSDAAGLRVPPAEDPLTATRVTFGRLFLGGIAAGDVDGDGDEDLFVPRIGPDYLLRNEGGRFRAEEFAEPGAGAAALFLDADNDGDLDLLVTQYEPEALRDRKTGELRPNEGRRALAYYRNDGGRFADATAAAGFSGRGPAMSACAADVDRDGDLDLFVCMYKDDAQADPRFAEEIPRDVFAARDGVPDQLWINRGDGTFREEGAERGVADPGWGLAASFSDFDDDGDPDLLLANDYGEKRLYRNTGSGRFEDVTAAAGAADTGFGMGVTWFDYDEDGRPDVYISNMYSTAGNRILSRGPAKLGKEGHEKLLKMARGNTLLRNRGDGTFEDVTARTGTGRAGWAWSSAAFDYDNDGLQDLYVANGFRTSGFATSDI